MDWERTQIFKPNLDRNRKEERFDNNMPISMHGGHSGQFCRHADQECRELEASVKEAIRQGFKVYGLSEHMPRYQLQHLYPEEVRQLKFTMIARAGIQTVHARAT